MGIWMRIQLWLIDGDIRFLRDRINTMQYDLVEWQERRAALELDIFRQEQK